MRTAEDLGNYRVPAGFENTGELIDFEFEYPVYAEDDVPANWDGCTISKAEALKLMNKSAKTNARNNASTSCKGKNKHLPERLLTPEQKAERKKNARLAKALLKQALASGKSADEILAEVNG